MKTAVLASRHFDGIALQFTHNHVDGGPPSRQDLSPPNPPSPFSSALLPPSLVRPPSPRLSYALCLLLLPPPLPPPCSILDRRPITCFYQPSVHYDPEASSGTDVQLVCEASRDTCAPFAVHKALSCGKRRHQDKDSGLQIINCSVHSQFFGL